MSSIKYSNKRLNPDQYLAATSKDSNILVFASAGAGKTTVLVERLKKRIIEDRINLDEIIAMTFTEAAANNIKKRLEKELRQLINDNLDDEFLKKQLSLLANAHISTIHSFCLSLIKEYYYLINLSKDATNNILSEALKKAYMHEAFSLAINEIDDLKILNQQIGASLFSFDALENSIKTIINKANSQFEPLKWLKRIKSSPINELNDLDDDVIKIYMMAIYDELYLANKYLDNLIDYTNTLENDKFSKYYLQSKEVINKALSLDDYNELLELLNNSSLKIMTKPKDPDYKHLSSLYKECLIKIASLLMPSSEIVKTYNDSIKYEADLLDLAYKTLDNYQNIKRERQVLDFDDFEHYALDILKANNAIIVDKLKKQYHEIMIDEFQDTSLIQYEIAKTISNNNLFLVGDIKQSIYRFRGALPKIMQSLKDDPSFKVINIRNNYRSKNSLIKFNNHIYNQIMNIHNNDFMEEDAQIYGIESQKEDNKDIYFYNVCVDELSDKEAKCRFIANDIYQKHQRGIAFKDMAILSRSHSDKKEMKMALKALNIPYYIEDNESYFNSKAINIIISFIKLCLDSNDKIAKVAILSSDMFDIDDSMLCELSVNNFKYDILDQALYELNKYYYQNDIVGMISYIININDYYNERLDLHERSNIDLLLSQLDSFNINNATDLLAYIEDNKEDLKDGAKVISSEADVVKMMTIHKSKGLEFDVVYLYSQSRNDFKESSDPILVDEKIGLGLKVVDYQKLSRKSTIKRMAISYKNNIDDILEYNRLLYVATTRPKKELIIVDSIENFIELPCDMSLLTARKGFSNLIYNVANNYDGMHILNINELDEYDALAYNRKIKLSLPKKRFITNDSQSISPSMLKKHSLDINPNLKVATDYGTRLHALFEHLDYHQEYDINSLKLIDNNFSDKVYDNILSFLNHEIILKAKTMDIYQEYSYFYKEENNYYHGYIDFLAYNKKEAIIIDYKSDHLEIEKEFYDRYHIQLEAYQKLIKDSLKLEVETYIYSIYLNSFIKV